MVAMTATARLAPVFVQEQLSPADLEHDLYNYIQLHIADIKVNYILMYNFR